MKEIHEIRIPEKNARLFLEPSEGRMIGSTVRQLMLDSRDPKLTRIADLHKQYRSRGDFLFYFSDVHRKYSEYELQQAKILHLRVSRFLEIAGEEHGTVYDENDVCPLCGVGRRQLSVLQLPVEDIPNKSDIFKTLGSEVVISSRLAELLRMEKVTGAEIRSVRPNSKQSTIAVPVDESLDPGRSYSIETLPGQGRPTRPRSQLSGEWHQLTAEDRTARLSLPTRAGAVSIPTDEDERTRCPSGHIWGINLQSELYIRADTVPQTDMFQTEEHFGVRRGLLVPWAPILVKQRIYQIFVKEKIRGITFEIARLQT